MCVYIYVYICIVLYAIISIILRKNPRKWAWMWVYMWAQFFHHWNQATLHKGISGFLWIFQRAEEILQTQTCSKDDIFEPLKNSSALHLLFFWSWVPWVTYIGDAPTGDEKLASRRRPWDSFHKSLPYTMIKHIWYLRRFVFLGSFDLQISFREFGNLWVFSVFSFLVSIHCSSTIGIHYYELVGGWTNPSPKNMLVKLDHFPNYIGVNKKVKQLFETTTT